MIVYVTIYKHTNNFAIKILFELKYRNTISSKPVYQFYNLTYAYFDKIKNSVYYNEESSGQIEVDTITLFFVSFS